MTEDLLLVQRVSMLTRFIPKLGRKVNHLLPRRGQQEVHAFDTIPSFLDAH